MSLREEYDKVFRSLSRVDLQAGAAELELPDLFGEEPERRLLGFYTEEGLRTAFERYGLFADLAEAGYPEIRLELRYDDPEEHLLRLWSVSPVLDEPLIELVVRRDVLLPTGELRERLRRAHIPVLNIEWLLMQRPDVSFDETRPPLPGQQFPGLGVGRQILELLRMAAKRLRLDALVTVPSYFHNAFFYDLEFQYVDPKEQGLFLALCRDVVPSSFGSVAAASWAINAGMVLQDGADEPLEWFHDVMLAPISEPLHEYLDAREYHAEVAAMLKRSTFEVNEEALSENLDARGILPLDTERIARWLPDEDGAE